VPQRQSKPLIGFFARSAAEVGLALGGHLAVMLGVMPSGGRAGPIIAAGVVDRLSPL